MKIDQIGITGSAVAPMGKVNGETQILTPSKINTP